MGSSATYLGSIAPPWVIMLLQLNYKK